MNCQICDAEFRGGDMRMRDELRGICLLCAEEGGFHGMTLEETTRCAAMLRAKNWEGAVPATKREASELIDRLMNGG